MGFCIHGHDLSIVGSCADGRCKECRRSEARRYYASHKDEVRARARRWHIENHARSLASKRAYAESHRDELAQYVRDRRRDDPEYRERARVRHERHRARNAEIIAQAKSVPCADCAGVFPACVMDFHHLDPSTKDNEVSRMRGANAGRLRAEIAKCVVLCANCHRIREHGATS